MIDSQVTTQAQNIASFTGYSTQLSLQDLSLNTLRKYRQILSAFQGWLQERPITAYAAKLFFAEMRERGYSQGTVRLHYVVTRAFLQYLGIPLKLKLRRGHHLPAYHSRDELQMILDAIDQAKGTSLSHRDRDKLMILTLALTGLRRQELLSLRAGDVQNNMVYVGRGKGDKDRVIPLAQALKQPLQDYIEQENIKPSSRLFLISPQRLTAIVKRYARLAGISDIHPHSLRHFFATTLIEQGAQLKAVQELMGHANISSTAIYMDLAQKHLESSVALLESVSVSVNKNIPKLGTKYKRLRLRLVPSNEQNPRQEEASQCGLKSKRVKLSMQPSILAQSRARHFFATTLIEQGAQLKAVQELMGHANISSTAIYMDLAQKHLESSVALLESVSVSVNKNIPKLGTKYKRLRLRLVPSNEQNPRQEEASQCGLKSKRVKLSMQPSILAQSRASPNTGLGSGASSVWGRDAPTALTESRSGGDTMRSSLSTASHLIGSLESKPWQSLIISLTPSIGHTSASHDREREGIRATKFLKAKRSSEAKRDSRSCQ